MTVFKRRELLGFLTHLDLELKEAARIYIIGGSAASIAYDAKEATMDIDTWEYEDRVAKAYDSLIGKKIVEKIPLSPVSIQIQSDEMKSRFFKFNELKLKHLEIFLPEPEDLFLLKAQRASEKDLDDLKNLSNIKKLDPDLLFNRFKKELLPQNPGNDGMLISSYLYCIAFIFGEDEFEKHQKNLPVY